MNIKKLVSIGAVCLCVVSSSWADKASTETDPAKIAVADSAITADVKSKISADKSLNGTSIAVKTSNGIVMLSGKVESDTQANSATEIAQSAAGVQDVNTSDLTVKGSKHPLTDALITAKVKGMYLQQKLFGDKDVAAMSIMVETNNGVVSLSGTADNAEQAANAVKIAKAVIGVKQVKSTVKISGSAEN